MTRPRHTIRQRDFTGGMIDAAAARRDDLDIVRCGCRQMVNFRQLNGGAIEIRPGRSVLFLANGRADEIRMSPTASYFLCFSTNSLVIRDAAFNVLATGAGYAWTNATVDQIVWTRAGNDIVITFPGQRPKMARWDGVNTWTFANYAFRLTANNKLLAPFARLAALGVTLTPSATTGAITLASSAAYFAPGMVGARLQWINHQILITAYGSPTSVSATVQETPLPPSSSYTATSTLGTFTPGEIVANQNGVQAEVVSFIAGALTVNHLTYGFNTGAGSDVIIGPNGRMSGTLTGTPLSPQPSVIWDEEIANDYRGWPRSCFFDQGRLGFCDFPGAPAGIAWSRIGVYDDFIIGAGAADPFFEFAPDQARVYHVFGGAGAEFVFTDRNVRFIPISTASPLIPGSVAFIKLTSDASSSIRPVETPEGVVFVNAGRTRIIGIIGTGQVTQQWITRDLTEFHSDIIRSPKTIAVSPSDGTLPERYLYVVNADGTLAVGRYDIRHNYVGWVLWDSAGSALWLSTFGSRVLLTTHYYLGAPLDVVETVGGAYLDAAVAINVTPALMIGHASQTVDVMDGLRYLGTRAVTSLGVIVPNPGDDLSAPTIIAGRWRAPVLEPFIPHAAEGQSSGQAITDRNIAAIDVAFQQSTGFDFGLPKRIVPPYEFTDNQEIAPPLREGAEHFSVRGSAIDPRVALGKVNPGPLRIIEITTDVSV